MSKISSNLIKFFKIVTNFFIFKRRTVRTRDHVQKTKLTCPNCGILCEFLMTFCHFWPSLFWWRFCQNWQNFRRFCKNFKFYRFLKNFQNISKTFQKIWNTNSNTFWPQIRNFTTWSGTLTDLASILRWGPKWHFSYSICRPIDKMTSNFVKISQNL